VKLGFSLREEHRFRMFRNGKLSRASGAKENEVIWA
jgi:hypothetical protein